jgi:hypothetical protein
VLFRSQPVLFSLHRTSPGKKRKTFSYTLYWTVGAVRRKDHLFRTDKKIKIKDSSLSPIRYIGWTVGAVRRKDHLFHTVKK